MGEEVADAEGGRPGAVDVVLIEQKTIPRRIGRGTEKVLRHGVPTRLRLPAADASVGDMAHAAGCDPKRIVAGMSVSVRVGIGGSGIMNKKNNIQGQTVIYDSK